MFDEELAKFASRAAAEDGRQLYEGIINFSNDEDEIARLLSASCNDFKSQFGDIVVSAEYEPTEIGNISVEVNAPDHPEKWVNDSNDIAAFIAVNAICHWMIKRQRQTEAEILSAERNAIAERLKHSLYQRKTITRE